MLATRLRPLVPQGRWWPYDTPFEVAVSAVLTQRARWEGAQVAMERLREPGLLTPQALAGAERSRVEACVRPAGFYRQKTRALQSIAARICAAFGGRIENVFALPQAQLREELLSWRGVGDETADAIMLFAAGKPAFVVDAYALRLMARFGAMRAGAHPSYGQVAQAWKRAGVRGVDDSREVHAAVVHLCKTHCRKAPSCAPCPLARGCKRVGVLPAK